MRRKVFSASKSEIALTVFGAFACVASILVISVPLADQDKLFIDWVTYANAVARVGDGSSLYAQVQLSGPYSLPEVVRIGYAYPPPSVVLFAPFSFGFLGLGAWIVFNTGFFITGLIAILRKGLASRHGLGIGITLVALSLFVPFAEGIASGNVNVAIAGAFAWLWVLGRSNASTGVIAGVGALVKVLPGVLIVWTSPGQFVRQATVAVVVVVLISTLTLPLVGSDSWGDFVVALRNAEPICFDSGIHPSIACLLDPVVDSDLGKLVGLGLGAALAGIALKISDPLAALFVIYLAWLAPASDTHAHYFLPLFPIGLIAATRIVSLRRQERQAAQP